MEGIVAKTHFGVSLEKTRITGLNFSSDVVVFTETIEVVLHSMDSLTMESKPIGLKTLLDHE